MINFFLQERRYHYSQFLPSKNIIWQLTLPCTLIIFLAEEPFATYYLEILWKILHLSCLISLQRLHLLFHGCNLLITIICLDRLPVTLWSSASITNAKETWSSSHSYLLGGTVTLTDRLNDLDCSWVASCSSQSESGDFLSDPSSFLESSKNSTPFIWASAELFGSPSCALSSISDLSYNIDLHQRPHLYWWKRSLSSDPKICNPKLLWWTWWSCIRLGLHIIYFLILHRAICRQSNHNLMEEKSITKELYLLLLPLSPEPTSCSKSY